MVSEAFSSHVYRESVHINRTLICSYLSNPMRTYVSNLIGYVWKLDENDYHLMLIARSYFLLWNYTFVNI